ncbi:MAG: HAD-IC family P-type ATPase [Bacilli bacterium]|jgi:cation-transporting ATPase E
MRKFSIRWKKKSLKIDEAINVERFLPSPQEGLDREQVAERIRQKLTNFTKGRLTKSYWEIIRTNIFSFFNILLYIIAAAMVAVRYFSGLFFLVILVLNTLIGLVQDIRAKKMVEKLSLISSPKVDVIRESEITTIDSRGIVLDDIVILRAGDQITIDGEVVDGTLNVDESLLTGESVAIHKEIGHDVLSGSFVTSGTARVRVNKVGAASFVQKLQAQAKEFKRPKSKLLGAINSLFKVIGVIVFLLAGLLILGNVYQGIDVATNVKRVSGSLVSMIPSGMYLLTSMTLTVGVINLGKKQTLVQEMYSIEMLARTDVLCIDKTGTITDGTMDLIKIHNLGNFPKLQVEKVLGSFLYATQDQSPTVDAILQKCPYNQYYQAETIIPFSSAAKMSAVTFANRKTFVLGAGIFVLNKKNYAMIRPLEKEYMRQGYRVLVLAASDIPIRKDRIPSRLQPVCLIVIQDHIREDAKATIRWFIENGVQIKVISGDDPITVGKVAEEVGIIGAENPVSLNGLSDLEVSRLALSTTVFGRVTPEQKAVIVQSLKRNGQTVAMIGDGVNDILALRQADCSAAMANGSSAANHVAHLVLQKSNFSSLPSVVNEGRRVINNLQRTWSLFLVKTFFSIIMTILFVAASILAPGGAEVAYPFTTQNMYVWEIAAIGVPAFFLALQPNHAKVEGTLMTNVITRALPAALTMVLGVITVYVLKAFDGVFHGSTGVNDILIVIAMAVFIMDFFSFVILFRISWPFNLYRAVLFVSLFTLTSILIAVSIWKTWDLFDIHYPLLTLQHILGIALIVIGMIILYFFLDRSMTKTSKRGHFDFFEDNNDEQEEEKA